MVEAVVVDQVVSIPHRVTGCSTFAHEVGAVERQLGGHHDPSTPAQQ